MAKQLFDGPIARLLRQHRAIRRLALVAGVLVGVYFLGAALNWWPRFLF